MKMMNEIRIRNALEKYENNRDEKLSKGIQRMNMFENQVNHFKE